MLCDVSGSGKTVVFEFALLQFFEPDLLDSRFEGTRLKPIRERLISQAQEQVEEEVEREMSAAGEYSGESDSTAPAPFIHVQKQKFAKRKALYMAPLKSIHTKQRKYTHT